MSEDLRTRFGKCVRAIRQMRSLTQAELAEMTTLSVEYLSKIERGLASPSFPVLERLCEGLAVETHMLFMDERSASDGSGALSALALHEVHHRVRNEFQILSGMVEHKMSNPSIPRDVVVRDVKASVQAMAQVHNQLLGSRLERLDLQRYCRELVRAVAEIHVAPGVTRKLDLEPVVIHADKAVALGMVLNELLCNAYTHAFPGGMGVLEIRLKRKAGSMALLVVEDNGPGIASQVIEALGHMSDFLHDGGCGAGMGLSLVRRIASNQLGGELRIEKAGGTRVSVSFPCPRRGA